MAERLIKREALNSTIRLDAYDPAWPAMFAREEARIRHAIGAAALAVHHAGSTSVPGLAAKPIIDIVLAVPDTRLEASYVPALEGAGYALHAREPDWFEHRLLKRGDPAVNLHVFSEGCSEIDTMLAFRDRLRTHEDDRRLYEAAKRDLAQRVWTYVQDYADAKTQVVREIVARATAK
ncbi:MAG: GrpB family protein [Caulobacterales bacterium]